jgi:O-antigen/teichoic acid export membrane protein
MLRKLFQLKGLPPNLGRDGSSQSLSFGAKWSTLLVVFSQVVRVLRGLIIPKLLEPAIYGLWTSLGVVLGYAQYADLGVEEQMAKRLPYRLSKDGETGYWQLARQGSGWGLVTALVVATALFAWSYLYQGPMPGFYCPALKLLAMIVVAQKFRLLGATFLRSRQMFRPLCIGGMLVEGLGLVLALGFLLWMGVLGLVWAYLLTEIIVLFYYFSRIGMLLPAFKLGKMWSLVVEGVFLLGVVFSEQVLMTLDQVFLLQFFSHEQYGIYVLGLFLTSALLIASGIFLTITQPRVMQLVGAGMEKEAYKVVDTSLSLYVVFLAMVIGGAVLIMDLVVNFYLTKYQPGMVVFVIMPALALVRGPVILLRPFFLARNQERRVIVMQISGLLVATLLDVLVVRQNTKDMVQIALASVVGYGVVAGAMAWDFERSSGDRSLRKYGIILIALIGTAGLFLFYANRLSVHGVWNYVQGSLLAVILYTLWVGLFVWMGRAHWLKVWRHFRQGTNEIGINASLL